MNVKIPVPVVFLLQTLHQKGYEAYLVGGAVRDLLLQKENITDWDITTNATPEQMLPLFTDSFYDNNFGTVMVAPKHVMAQMGRSENYPGFDVFDITTFRNEFGYSDRRRPDVVVWGQTLEEDLKRRDFTINAIAIDTLKLETGSKEDGQGFVEGETEIIDRYQSVDDLNQKLIRAVGDPDQRFKEDALRMMRAIRIGAQLGFTIETGTLTAITNNAQLLESISWERIRDELMKIIGSPYPGDGIQLLAATGLLDYILPELTAGKNVPQGGHHIYDVYNHSLESLKNCPSSDRLVRLATLLHDIGKPRTIRFQGPRGVTFYGHEVVGARMAVKIAERLRLSNKDKDKLYTLIRWHMFTYDPQMTDAAIRRFIKRVGLENINDMIMLRIGDRKGGGSKATSWRLRELQVRIGENLYTPMSTKDLVINGTDIMTLLVLKPGPIIGKILNQLFEEVMEDKLENSKESLELRARELHSQIDSSIDG
jgi:putative nucleotidyltransferase with HDIG domain